jgi:polyhydroxyalkanoate synthesis repressor PhaR
MPRTIKKYANRRLYDTRASRHVTLEGIRQLVAAGEDVTVVDDASGRDITRNILLQVVMEQEQGERPLLSAEVLKSLIRCYGSPGQARLASGLEQCVESYLREETAGAPGTRLPPAVHPHEGGPPVHEAPAHEKNPGQKNPGLPSAVRGPGED